MANSGYLHCLPPRGAISAPTLGVRASAHADDTVSIRRLGLGCLSTPHNCQDSPSCCRRTSQAPNRKHHSGSRTSRCLILNGAYRCRTRDRTPWSASGVARQLCAPRVAVGIEQTLRQHFFACRWATIALTAALAARAGCVVWTCHAFAELY